MKAGQSAELSVSEDVLDVQTVPPPWPFSVPRSVSPSVSSVPERQSGGVWLAERPPLAEEEPDFLSEDFNTVCVTSPPVKAPAGGDVEKKSPLPADEASSAKTVCDEEVPVPNLIALFITEEDEKTPGQTEPKQEPLSQTGPNWSDQAKVSIADGIVSSLLRGECEDGTRPDREHTAVTDNR